MTNAARALHDLLSEWVQPGAAGFVGVADSRGLSTVESDGPRQLHRRALDLIQQVADLETVLATSPRSAEALREHLRAWNDMVIAYPEGWIQPITANTTGLNPRASLQYLEQIAERLDETLPEPPHDQRDSLEEAVRAALDFLDDPELPTNLKRHLGAVLAHAQSVLAETRFSSDFDVQGASERLISTLMHLSDAMTNPDKKAKALRAAKKLFFAGSAYIGAIAAGALTATATSVVQEMVETVVESKLGVELGESDIHVSDNNGDSISGLESPTEGSNTPTAR